MIFSFTCFAKHEVNELATNYSINKIDPLDSILNNKEYEVVDFSKTIVSDKYLDEWLKTYDFGIFRRLLISNGLYN